MNVTECSVFAAIAAAMFVLALIAATPIITSNAVAHPDHNQHHHHNG
ncbi:MAG: hypothetical protein WBP64_04030 [Nitrososphaeraceae archaeon]